MTSTTYHADSYNHRADLAHYIEQVRMHLATIETEWSTYSDEDEDRRAAALRAVGQVDELAGWAAKQLQNYVVGWARFEGATWPEVGQALDVSKQAASERFRHWGSEPRRGDVLGTLTSES